MIHGIIETGLYRTSGGDLILSPPWSRTVTSSGSGQSWLCPAVLKTSKNRASTASVGKLPQFCTNLLLNRFLLRFSLNVSSCKLWPLSLVAPSGTTRNSLASSYLQLSLKDLKAATRSCLCLPLARLNRLSSFSLFSLVTYSRPSVQLSAGLSLSCPHPFWSGVQKK